MSRQARILVAELIGTMILILGGPGTVIFGQFLGFNIGVLGVALAFGLSLLCAAYLFGHISGCHINPAVTVGMWALKRTDGKDVPAYLVGQILGAAIGAFVLWAILETGDNGGGRKLAREALFGGASNGFADHSPSGFAFWAVGSPARGLSGGRRGARREAVGTRHAACSSISKLVGALGPSSSADPWASCSSSRGSRGLRSAKARTIPVPMNTAPPRKASW